MELILFPTNFQRSYKWFERRQPEYNSEPPKMNKEEKPGEESEDCPTVSPHTVSDDDEIDYSVKPEFYDPKLDDKDELWVQKKRKGHTSDAVLSCPACFTSLCLDCQRHEKYLTQYRAMHVLNCKIKDKPVSQAGSKRKRSRRQHGSTETVVDVAKDEAIRLVCCAVCSTEIVEPSRRWRDPKHDLEPVMDRSDRLHGLHPTTTSTRHQISRPMFSGRHNRNDILLPNTFSMPAELPPPGWQSSSSQHLMPWAQGIYPPYLSYPPYPWPPSASTPLPVNYYYPYPAPAVQAVEGSYSDAVGPSYFYELPVPVTPIRHPEDSDDEIDDSTPDTDQLCDNRDISDTESEIEGQEGKALDEHPVKGQPDRVTAPVLSSNRPRRRPSQHVATKMGNFAHSVSDGDGSSHSAMASNPPLHGVSDFVGHRTIATQLRDDIGHTKELNLLTGATTQQIPSGYLECPGGIPTDDSPKVMHARAATESTGCRRTRRRAMQDDWRLTESAAGGPHDPSLIPSFTGHVAIAIWSGKERPVLKVHQRAHVLARWGSLNPSIGEIVRRSGLTHLSDCIFDHVNMPLISAFVERWQPDTNTFHMPFGEMTITLHDVAYILGIPVTGQLISHSLGREAVISDISSCLRASPAFVRNQLDNGGLKFTVLHEAASNTKLLPSEQSRAYLAYLLGCTLFIDKSKIRVPYQFWPLLSDVDSVSQCAWGAGCLAFLYRQLGTASRADCKQLAGAAALLEAWIYLYFPMFAPQQSRAWRESRPHVLRFKRQGPVSRKFEDLRSIRLQLDNMTGRDVCWTPYGPDPLATHWISAFHGCLRYCDIVEPYMPDRVLRQFGRIQCIPKSPISPKEDFRPSNNKKYVAKYISPDEFWIQSDSHILRASQLGSIAVPPWACVPDYMEWYLQRTHSKIQNPDHLPMGVIPPGPAPLTDTVRWDMIHRLLQVEDDPSQMTIDQMRAFIVEVRKIARERARTLAASREGL